MDLLLILLILLLIFGVAGGFALHILWLVAVVALVFIAVRFIVRRA
jgi:hypothetical protein